MNQLRERAEEEAIRVFARNLHDLLLAAPAGQHTVIGLDPGIRTGVKVAVVDATGKVVGTSTIYPHEPRRDWEGSLATLRQLAQKHGAGLISIGNGTASRETDKLAAELMRRHPELKRPIVVSEAGAPVTRPPSWRHRNSRSRRVLRGAVSIARRLQDPAELVRSNLRQSASASTNTTSTSRGWHAHSMPCRGLRELGRRRCKYRERRC